jgi:hypothetical protein
MMQRFKKKIILDKASVFFIDNIKMWMIHFDIPEIFVILQLTKYQGDVLEQDIELCLFGISL